MGLFDKLKSATETILEETDKAFERQVKKFTDVQLLEKLVEHPDNKYLRNEAKRRGLL